jgi:pilus assembly protein CpaC
MRPFELGQPTKLILALGIALLLVGTPAWAQSEGQALHVFVGKSVVINLQSPVTRILSSNPAIIDTLATSPTQVVVEGKAPGSSSLILWDATGHSQMLDVTVDVNVSRLRTAIEQTYAGQAISVQSDGAHLILTGTVSDAKIVDDVGKMAALYSPGVVNSLVVAPVHEQQILLEVKFAEVDRTKIQQLGFNFFSTGAANTIGSVSTQQFTPPTLSQGSSAGASGPISTTLTFNDLLNIFLFRPDINLGTTIRDLETKSVLQILAQPNLLALNGQKASFLAGGEFPFPVVQGGSGNTNAVTIQFRPFGVRLDFTGFIGKDGIIRMHVAPEVSTLDFSNALVISGFTVPAISTRRAETEIELREGQSFGIGGLIDNRAQVQFSKIPGIGDIPIIGQLFRSHSLNRSHTELVVLVTPHVVDPVKMSGAPPSLPANPVKFLNTPAFDKNLPAKTPGPGQDNSGSPPPTNSNAPSPK